MVTKTPMHVMRTVGGGVSDFLWQPMEGMASGSALGLASGVGLSNLGPVGLSRGVDRVNQGSKRVRNSQL